MNERLSSNMGELMKDLQAEAQTAKIEPPKEAKIVEKPLTPTEKAVAENLAEELAAQKTQRAAEKKEREQQRTKESLVRSITEDAARIKLLTEMGNVNGGYRAFQETHQKYSQLMDLLGDEETSLQEAAQAAFKKARQNYDNTLMAWSGLISHTKEQGMTTDPEDHTVHTDKDGVMRFSDDTIVHLNTALEQTNDALSEGKTDILDTKTPFVLDYDEAKLNAALLKKGIRATEIKSMGIMEKLNTQLFDSQKEAIDTQQTLLTSHLNKKDWELALVVLDSARDVYTRKPSARLLPQIKSLIAQYNTIHPRAEQSPREQMILHDIEQSFL